VGVRCENNNKNERVVDKFPHEKTKRNQCNISKNSMSSGLTLGLDYISILESWFQSA
jgi:hypothetical protein